MNNTNQATTTSLSHDTYKQFEPQRPIVIKKLQDNLQVADGNLLTADTPATTSQDYKPHQYGRPVIKRIASSFHIDGDMQIKDSLSKSDYPPPATPTNPAHQPIKKLQDNLITTFKGPFKNNNNMQMKSLNQSTYANHESYPRPVINRILDTLTFDGQFAKLSVHQQDFGQLNAQRPTIKRLQSSLKIGAGSMKDAKSLAHDTYQDLHARRPITRTIADNLGVGGAEMLITQSSNHADFRHFQPIERPIVQKSIDNLTVAGDNLRSVQQSTQRADYANLNAKRPVINKLADTFTLAAGGGGEEHVTGYNSTYVNVHSERPVIRKMAANLSVSNEAQFTRDSVNHADYPTHQVKRPTVTKPATSLVIGRRQSSLDRVVAEASSASPPSPPPFTGNKKSVNGATHARVINQLQSSIKLGDQHDQQPIRAGARGKREAPLGGGGGGGGGGRVATAGRRVASGGSGSGRKKSLSSGVKMKKTAFLSSVGIGVASASPASPYGRFTSTVRSDYNDAAAGVIKAEQAKLAHKWTDSTLTGMFAGAGGRVDGAGAGHDASLYQKSFTLPVLQPCEAAFLNNQQQSNYQFSRQVDNHIFYKPIKVA